MYLDQTSHCELVLAELPDAGFTFDYAVYERPRLGRDVFRPAVPVSLGPKFRRGIVGLVDSGSEHTLASRELPDDTGLDLSEATKTLRLGIGGQSAEAVFETVEIRLYRDHHEDEFVSWFTEVGFLAPWNAEFFVILGQIGFFDEFTVSMNRRLLVVHIDEPEALLVRINPNR